MQLTAVLEGWHLSDGNYPEFRVGDEARLSFAVHVKDIEPAQPWLAPGVEHRQDAHYEIVADIIRWYDSDSRRFSVLEADWFRFYIPFRHDTEFPLGARMRIRGELALDHFLWVEFLDEWPDPPELFYGCRVTRIRQVPIPDEFVTRGERGEADPTSLSVGEYAAESVVDITDLKHPKPGRAFFLLDLELLPPGAGPERPTFFFNEPPPWPAWLVPPRDGGR